MDGSGALLTRDLKAPVSKSKVLYFVIHLLHQKRKKTKRKTKGKEENNRKENEKGVYRTGYKFPAVDTYPVPNPAR